MTGTQVTADVRPSQPGAKDSEVAGYLGLAVMLLFLVGVNAVVMWVRAALGIGWWRDYSDGTHDFQGPEGEARVAGLLGNAFKWLLGIVVVLGAIHLLGR